MLKLPTWILMNSLQAFGHWFGWIHLRGFPNANASLVADLGGHDASQPSQMQYALKCLKLGRLVRQNRPALPKRKGSNSLLLLLCLDFLQNKRKISISADCPISKHTWWDFPYVCCLRFQHLNKHPCFVHFCPSFYQLRFPNTLGMQPWHADVSCEWAPIFPCSPPKTTRDLHPQNELLRKIGKNNSIEPIAKARDKSSEPEKKVVSQPTYSTKNTEMDPLEKNQKANKSTSKIIGNKLFFQKNSRVSSCGCHTMILFWVLGMCSLKLTL